MSEENKRKEHRRRVLKGGTIILDKKASEISCTVRNQHEHGAELLVPLECVLTDTFLLYVAADNIAYECTLRWRKRERVGVQFTGTAPKPRLHYG